MSDGSLIITIVNKGWGEQAMRSAMKAGAEGGTIIMGRGVGIHEEKQNILGIPIEPEKEIVLSVTYPDKTQAILDSVINTCELDEPGSGIAFVVPVEKVVGVCHLNSPKPTGNEAAGQE
ncbi:nitrogen regulatory protein P-II family [Dehalogenimonas alkenigignens]|uniref:Nitrogen regulatory protein P-II family n=1 Tax=Dehalogenimonas alkenigignens TaxID=1217799 RepID=A0A0W0GK93_9CHLR|nr:P-II family nitrogen regulator [Dehalogenimonas alkenigignens]KTB48958.1 nitrogen regulatory protein P-II family [Dehalogenimonas alkenigignens]